MVFSNNLLLGAGGQGTAGPTPFDPTLIGNSVWLDGSADFLNKSFSGSASATEGVYSIWVQRTGYGTDDGIFATYGTIDSATKELLFAFRTDNKLQIYWFQSGSGSVLDFKTTRVFRDTGWYHILFSYKTDEAAASDRAKLYINGILETAFDTKTDPSASFAPPRPFASVPFGIGVTGETGALNSDFLDGYVAQSTFLDGHSIQGGDVAVTDFLDSFTYGTNGSQFSPKSDADIAALATTAGGNSFCLDFANSSDLGNDISSNNNDFTPNSMSSANQVTSSPSIVYPVWNALEASATLSNGNLNARSTTSQLAAQATQSVSSGKFYWEITANSSANQLFGITGEAVSYANRIAVAFNYSPTVFFYGFNGNIYQDGSSTAYDSAISVGDVIGIAVDFDAGKIWFAKNNAWLQSGDPANGTSPSATFTVGTFTPSWCAGGASGDRTGATDFGQLGFTYTPPTDFVSLNSANLSAPDYQGIDYFDATLYEGNGTGQRVGNFVPFTDAFNVANSAMFDSSDLRYLARTPSSGGNEKTLTFSTWIKITGTGNSNENAVLTTDDGSKEAQIRITGGTLATKKVQANLYNGSSFVLNISTDRTFGDTSSWNHLVVAYDTRAAVASANKVIIYINGVRQSVSGTDLATDDYDTEFNSTNEHNIGRQTNNAIGEPDFYLAETVMIDGQQLDASSFGQLDTATNRWVPKDVSGLTFGTNGFYLQYGSTFASGSGAGTDTSGNSNNWTESTDGGSAWATSDQFTDTPSNNYATLNRIIPPTPSHSSGGNAAMSQGNLKWDVTINSTANSSFQTTPLAFQIQDGKWYYELESVDSAGGNLLTGLVDMQNFQAAGSFINDAVDGQIAYGIAGSGGTTDTIYTDTTTLSGSNSPLNGADDIDNGDVLGVYIEKSKDTYNFWFSRNGTMLVRDTSGLPIISYSRSEPMCVFVRSTNNTTKECALNFGQQMVFDGGATTASAATGGRWKHVPTNTAYKALNVDNLDDTASKITAWAWIKNREATDNHMLFDRVRGVGNDIHSNDTAIEVSNANTVQRFLQRGVQVGSDVEVNTANESYVLWQWLLGDSATTGTAISADNPPTIASTNLASDNGSFGICTYTGNTSAGATVKHSLGGVPEMILFKRYGATTANWMVYHKDAGTGNSDYLMLDTTGAKGAAGAVAWLNATTPTSTLVTLGSDSNVNASDTYIMYLFRSIAGVCKVGSYNGNSSDDGPYLSLGFKPAWWMVKETTVSDASHDWFVADSTRYIFNGTTTAGGLNGGTLEANDSTAEEAHNTNFTDNPAFDFLADGIKLRSNSGTINATGRTYIYLAMADIGGNGTLPPVYGR